MFEVNRLLETYCQHSRTFRGVTPRGVKTLNHELSAFLRDIEVAHLEDITRPVIERYILEKKRDRNWSSKTIRNRIITIRGFLKWGVQQELIEQNPAKNIPLPRLRKRLPRALPTEVSQELLEWTKSYEYEFIDERPRAIAIIATFLYAGLRHAELRSLNRTDVDMTNRKIFVRGKGDKDRIVPISKYLLPYLEDYLDWRKKVGRHCPAFFASIKQDARMDECVISRLVEKLREASGIHFTPHMLRHTFATNLIRGGARLTSVQEVMGHSNIETTRSYIEVALDDMREDVDKNALGATEGQFRRTSSLCSQSRHADTSGSSKYQHDPLLL
ncbi:MAG: tyrosine-type recombinase/integrase [Pseudomonadota bacterium]